MAAYSARTRAEWSDPAAETKFYDHAFSPQGVCTQIAQGKVQSLQLAPAQRACLKIKNFEIATIQLRKCGIDLGGDIEKRAFNTVLWGLAQTSSESISLDCTQVRKSLLKQVTQLVTLSETDVYNDSVNKTIDIAAKNAAQAYYAATRTYEAGFEADPRQGLCPQGVSFAGHDGDPICGQFGLIIDKEFARLNQLHPYTVHSTDSIFSNFDKRLSRMNTSLAKIVVKGQCRIGNGKTGNCDEFKPDWYASGNTHYENYKQYVKEFNQAVTEPGGMILDSEAMQKEIGHFRSLSDMPEPSHSSIVGTYAFKTDQMHGHDQLRRPGDPCVHPGPCGPPLSPEKRKKLLSRSVDDVKARIREEMRSLADMKKDSQDLALSSGSWYRGTKKNPLERLVRTNPLAIGQLLIENPDRADVICTAIKNLPRIKESEDRWKTAWLTGGTLAGVAVAVALPAVGLAIDTGIAGTLVGMGVSVAAGSAEVFYDYGTATLERSTADNHMIGNNQDPESLRRAAAAERKYDIALTKLVANGFMRTPPGKMLMSEVSNQIKSTEVGAQLENDLNDLANLATKMAEQKLSTLNQFLKGLGEHPSATIQKLARSGNESIESILNALKSESITPGDVKLILSACEGDENTKCIPTHVKALSQLSRAATLPTERPE